MTNGDLTDVEREIIKVRLESMKDSWQASLIIMNKVFWIAGIIAVGILVALLAFLSQLEITIKAFLSYVALAIPLTVITFVIIIAVLGKLWYIPQTAESPKKLIRDIIEGNLLK